jgi:hypothetical protein
MTSLEAHQREMLDLIKNRRNLPARDAFPGLSMLREIALWWRAMQLTAQCPFTAMLLKRLALFDHAVSTYFQQNAVSPFIEQLARDFLERLDRHEDPLVRAMARFELAISKTRDGSGDTFEIQWDRNPDTLFQALQDRLPLPPAEPGCEYRMVAGNHVPSLIACSRWHSAASPHLPSG